MASAVNINWLFGASCRFCRSGYAATKGGLVSMARSIAADLAPRNIRVNVVAPGAIKTPIWKRGPRASASAEDSAKLAKFFSSAVPQGRWGEPEEVAKAVLFLASDDSSYINAVELMVDGGLTGAPLGAPIFRTDLGRWVARRSWQKLMRKEIRSEVDNGTNRKLSKTFSLRRLDLNHPRKS